jgi:signal transduction histidine kinase
MKFHAARRPEIQIAADASDHGWTFTVADNGLGIKPEHFERIFQPFRRVHVQANQEGTGIGLAICRKVVERHGGRIWVESVPGQGARFLFTLSPALKSDPRAYPGLPS